MSGLIARKLARRASWLPHGAQEYLNLRAGRYWTGRKAHGTLADALAAAGFAFARASQASYFTSAGTLAYAASGALRLDYHPATLAPLGLLVEGAKTSINLNPEAIDNAYWTKTGSVTIDADLDVARDGAQTADRVRPPSGTSSGYSVRRGSLAVVNGSTYTVSAFMKSGGANVALIGFDYSATLKGSYPDIVNGANLFNLNAATGAAKAVGNGWVRGSATHTIAGVSSTAIIMAPVNQANNQSFTGDAVKYFDLWGVELELGAFATSYTAGAARSADSLTRAITQPDRLCRAIGFTAPPGVGTNVIWQMDDGTAANRVRLVRTTAGAVRLIVTASSVETANLVLGTVASESFNRVAIQFDGTAFKAVMNANPTVQSATAAIPAVTTERIGSSSTAGEELNGWIAEFATYGSLADGGLVEASRVFPSWVPTDSGNQPADIFFDMVNGRFWAKGNVYPTLALMQTALGATVTSPTKWSIPWTDATVTMVVEAMTGDAKTSGVSQVFAAIDNSTGTQYERIYLGGGVNGFGADCFYGAPQFGMEDPYIAAKYGTRRVAVTMDPSNFSIQFDTGSNKTQASGGVIQTPLVLRFGDDAGSLRPVTNGSELWKFAIFASPKSSSEVQLLANAHFPAIVAGDSYVGGSYNSALPMSWSRLNRRMIRSVGVGGDTLATQTGLALTLIAANPTSLFLFWDGKSNGYDPDIAVDKAYYTSMANACLANGQPFIFYAPVSSTYDLSPTAVARQQALAAWLRATWPSNSIDIREYAATLGLTGNDAADIANNLTPRSWFRPGDEAHMLESVHDDIHTNVLMPIVTAGRWLKAE